MTAPRLFTPEDLARDWDRSLSFVRKQARLGLIEYIRIGGAVRFTAEAVADYEARRTRPARTLAPARPRTVGVL